jgi:hypothetical protein
MDWDRRHEGHLHHRGGHLHHDPFRLCLCLQMQGLGRVTEQLAEA